MKLNDNDLRITWTKGSGPGGQRKNKVETACRIVHEPSGVVVFADERTRSQSKKEALSNLRDKLQKLADVQRAEKRKAKRDAAIKDTTVVRTYNYSRDEVKDHRTGKIASIKDIVIKGQLDKLR